MARPKIKSQCCDAVMEKVPDGTYTYWRCTGCGEYRKEDGSKFTYLPFDYQKGNV